MKILLNLQKSIKQKINILITKSDFNFFVKKVF